MNNKILFNQLTNEEKLLVNSEIEKRRKNPVIAYLLWFLLGFMGGHRYYMGKTGSAVAMTLIFWLLVWIFGLGAIITGIWAIVDVFLISGWLKDDQEKIENKVAQDIIYSRNTINTSQN
ncbi:TM2 domain-containing protein [Bombilactobacillus bombi]|uniref:TM2 domain-containing protein n=1 Tax=Bombilactobacillus bombi TaxID=1303590 RepID=A0A3R6UXH5_9LACO|nr:TM2 domain-containing protein [Bombilactobacillus bombi]RHW49747.1 TM2 domain-containing protein [Bombilactobacillus bombi]